MLPPSALINKDFSIGRLLSSRVWIASLALMLLGNTRCAPSSKSPVPLPTLSPPKTPTFSTPLPPKINTTTVELVAETIRVVAGSVIAGGDVTPKDLADAPRKFVYEIRTEDSSLLYIAYTAYPPSPAGSVSKIKLKFHAGTVLIGDYLIARGSYDKNTNMLSVMGEGDYIETYSRKP